MDAATMASLLEQVLIRFAVELDDAVTLANATGCACQFDHLARRAECPTRGDLGRRERDLVNTYRARLTGTGASVIGGVR